MENIRNILDKNYYDIFFHYRAKTKKSQHFEMISNDKPKVFLLKEGLKKLSLNLIFNFYRIYLLVLEEFFHVYKDVEYARDLSLPRYY